MEFYSILFYVLLVCLLSVVRLLLAFLDEWTTTSTKNTNNRISIFKVNYAPVGTTGGYTPVQASYIYMCYFGERFWSEIGFNIESLVSFPSSLKLVVDILFVLLTWKRGNI